MKRFVTIAVSLVALAPFAAAQTAEPKPAKLAKAEKPAKQDTVAVGTTGAKGNEITSYRMKVVTHWGTEFTGVVKRTKEFDDAFANTSQLAGAKFDPQKFVELRWFNGLNGSVSFRFRDIRTIERLDDLTNDSVSQIETKQAGERVKRVEKEQVRLSIVKEQRAAKQKAEAELVARAQAAKAQKALAELESPPQYKVWLDQVPPEKGWIPAKKAQLYYNQVVLGLGAPSAEEKEWVDHYEEWKVAYDWWVAEQKAITGEDPPIVDANPGHPANAIDGDNVLDLRNMPPVIEHDDKTPTPPADAKDKPAPVDPAVPPPIKNDGQP